MRKGKYILTVFLILGFIGTLTVFLPQIMTYLNNYHFFSTKVNDNFTRLSRLEFIKICVSVLGPVLTMMVFLNTLDMQMKTEEKQNKLEEKQDKAEKRRAEKEEELYQKDLLLQIDHEFYSLLNMFIELQKDESIKKAISVLYEDAIFSEYGFQNDYKYVNLDLSDSPIKNEIERSGPMSGRVYFKEFTNYDESIKKFKYSVKDAIVEEDLDRKKVELINEQYEHMHKYLGRYFRMFHRIIKTLNEYLDDENKFDKKKYSKYIGTLRTQISSVEFQVIIINSIYVKRGLGLGIQLVGSGFLGDVFDFEINQHFDTCKNEEWFLMISTLEQNNIEIRRELYNYANNLEPEEYKRISNFKNLKSQFDEKES